MAANRKRRRAPKRGTAEMTEFGKTLHRLMVAHEVYEWKDLIRLLKEKAGYEIGQPRLSSYLYGDRNPRHPQRFFDAVAVALDLDEEEKAQLTFAYGYPANASRENIRRIEEKKRQWAEERQGGEGSRHARPSKDRDM